MLRLLTSLNSTHKKIHHEYLLQRGIEMCSYSAQKYLSIKNNISKEGDTRKGKYAYASSPLQ